MRTLRLLPVAVLALSAAAAAQEWSFAVSGDSRDCGDLVMPKIAASVLAEGAPPVSFYWHLGDFRRMYDIDCDILVRTHPGYDCNARPTDVYGEDEASAYEVSAWQDAADHQFRPFGKLPVFLGVGNHEHYAGHTREEFLAFFRPWLSQKALHLQRLADVKRDKDIEAPFPTTYHLVMRGVDLVYLDNSGKSAFTPEQILWLTKILALDAKNPDVKSIVLATHAALPRSKAASHAMDASCQGLCSGQQVYEMLHRQQALGKKVYLLASHSHYFVENAWDTPAHAGEVIPGWIVGTAGAIQSGDRIRYGWVKLTVHADGSITGDFREVTRSSPPESSEPWAAGLADFCFTQNIRPQSDDSFKGDCVCGTVTSR